MSKTYEYNHLPKLFDKKTPLEMAHILENIMSPRFVFIVKNQVLRTHKMPNYKQFQAQIPYIYRDGLDRFAAALIKSRQKNHREEKWQSLKKRYRKHTQALYHKSKLVDKSR